jgi:hypothetical protein
MSSLARFSFDARLSLDGVMTLAAGVIAFLAVLLQIRSLKNQVNRQLKAERKARIEDADARRRAVAKAILFEIDHFYRFYIQDVLKLLDNRLRAGLPPAIHTPGPRPFPVYWGNCSRLGDLDDRIVEAVVHSYGMAQGYVSALTEYAARYDLGVREDSPRAYQLAEQLLPRIRNHCEALVPMVFLTCGLLCFYSGVHFEMPTVAVANDTRVTKETRESLMIGIKQLQAAGGAFKAAP